MKPEDKNIVLIGMPGCGKSTVGKALANRLGREFFDSDAEFESRSGTSISDFFAAEGENAFRREESRIIENLGKKIHAVISTGGGVVTRPENIENLARNGFIVFLDRPLEDIRITSDRPLTPDRESLRKKYTERYSLYCGAANLHLETSGNEEETVTELLKALAEQGLIRDSHKPGKAEKE